MKLIDMYKEVYDEWYKHTKYMSENADTINEEDIRLEEELSKLTREIMKRIMKI